MATFSELQAQVLRRVIDAPTAVVTEVPSLVNKAIRKAEEKHDYMCMRTTATYTTTENSITLGAMPADFKAIRDYPYRLANDGTVTELRVAPNARPPRRMWGNLDIGAPRILTFGTVDKDAEGNFIIFPGSDALSDYDDGLYRIVVPYWRFLPALSADADFNWFTTNGEEYIVDYATAEAFRINWDEKRADYWAKEASMHYRDMRKANTQYVLGGMDLLIPFVDANQPDITE